MSTSTNALTPKNPKQAFNTPNIKIISASFAQSDASCKPTGSATGTNVDLMKRIQAMCNKQSTCAISVDGNTLGDPSPGCKKKLDLKYTCGGAKINNGLTVTDDSAISISCNREAFTAVGPDGRVYKTLPPCKYHGYKCPYYWDCRPNLTCPVEGFKQMFYTAEGGLQIYH